MIHCGLDLSHHRQDKEASHSLRLPFALPVAARIERYGISSLRHAMSEDRARECHKSPGGARDTLPHSHHPPAPRSLSSLLLLAWFTSRASQSSTSAFLTPRASLLFASLDCVLRQLHEADTTSKARALSRPCCRRPTPNSQQHPTRLAFERCTGSDQRSNLIKFH